MSVMGTNNNFDLEWAEFCLFQRKFWELLKENNINPDNKYILEYCRGFGEKKGE